MVKKDKKRTFDKEQREFLYKIQNKKCNICKKYFPLSILEGAHSKPHSAGGKTQVENGFLCCPNCHSVADKKKIKVVLELPKSKKPKTKTTKSKKQDPLFGIGKSDPTKSKKIPKSFGF